MKYMRSFSEFGLDWRILGDFNFTFLLSYFVAFTIGCIFWLVDNEDDDDGGGGMLQPVYQGINS